MPQLFCGGRYVGIAVGEFLVVAFCGDDTASSAVEAGPVAPAIPRDAVIVEGVYAKTADVVIITVVIEGSPPPISTIITVPPITKSIIYATVEADMRAPVPGVIKIHPIVPGPIAGGP
jgi:hypothetical protein